MGLSASRERFARDDLARRLGAIAANLSRIRSFMERGAGQPLISSLIDESKQFIEDTARSTGVDLAVQLLELQRLLARWTRALDAVPGNDLRSREIARDAAQWSDRMLRMSGMLEARTAVGSDTALVVPHRHKYAIIALPGVWPGFDVVSDGGFVVSSRPPLVFSDFWVRRTGEHYTEVFRDAGFYIMRTRLSERPESVDQENDTLVRSVEGLRLALALASPRFRTNEAIGVTGGNPEGEAEMRMAFRYPQILSSPAMRRWQVEEADIRRATALVGPLASIQKKSRVWKAIVCFSRGLESKHGDDRLHEFVRCIEGFIAPEIGRTKEQFRKRVRSVVADVSEEALDEMFDLRSATEHLNDAGVILTAAGDSAFFRRVDEAEAIARHFIQNVVEKPALLDVFRRDESLRAFWSDSPEARHHQWGPPLKLGEALAAMHHAGSVARG